MNSSAPSTASPCAARESAAPSSVHFPPELRKQETAWIDEQKPEEKQPGDRLKRSQVGLAFSGGGIRSATFCLGFMQGLARLSQNAAINERTAAAGMAAGKNSWLRRFGYLSTVSGGGFFGGFLTQLFQRAMPSDNGDASKRKIEAEQVESFLTGRRDPASAEPFSGVDESLLRHPLHWLRENGRYLIPSGGGDVWLAFAGVLRNWLSVQIFLAMGLLLVLLSLQALRLGSYQLIQQLDATNAWLTVLDWEKGTVITWAYLSPFPLLALAVLIFGAAPLGSVYWSIGSKESRKLNWVRALLLSVPPALIASLCLRWLFPFDIDQQELAIHAVGLGLVTSAICLFQARAIHPAVAALLTSLGMIVYAATAGVFHWLSSIPDRNFFENYPFLTLFAGCWSVFLLLSLAVMHDVGKRFVNQNKSEGSRSPVSQRWPNFPRHELTQSLARLLPIAVGLMLLGLIDMAGARLYSYIVDDGKTIGLILTFIGSGLLAGKASGVGNWFARTFSGMFNRMSLATIALIFGSLIFIFWSVVLSALVHAILWSFDAPKISLPTWNSLAFALFFIFILVFISRFFLNFTNSSSLHGLYSQRLARAYFGASNWQRAKEQLKVTQTIDTDDMVTFERMKDAVANRGAPFHIVNACLNETVHTEMGVQQLDRKGLGLAVSALSISTGARHHLLTQWALPKGGSEDEQYLMSDPQHDSQGIWADLKSRWNDEPMWPAAAQYCGPTGASFRPFLSEDDANKPSQGEPIACMDRSEILPFSQWVAISGAAFSTGTGFRSSIGTALLCGFFGVRTGYWWNSGTDGSGGSAASGKNTRTAKDQMRGSTALAGMFPTYALFWTELTASFRGTNARRWYLSDGGHFENLGVYELIRRRLKFVLVIDAGCDANNEFEDLANLTRKARIDFGADITFFDADGLAQILPGHRYLGSLGDLSRRKGRTHQQFLNGAAKTAARHAALARIDYGDQIPDPRERFGFLLYVKPTVVADDLPNDLTEYLQRNPDFPQQTTSDQFFDESQWESYRAIGDLISSKLFQQNSGAENLFDELLKHDKPSTWTDLDREPQKRRFGYWSSRARHR